MPPRTHQNLGQIAKQANVPITSVWKVMLDQGGMIDYDEFTRIKALITPLETDDPASDERSNGAAATQPTGSRIHSIGISLQTPTKGVALGYQGVIMDAITRAIDPKRQLLVTYYYVYTDFPNMQDFVQHVDGVIIVGGVRSQVADACRNAGRPYVLVDPGSREIDELGVMLVIDNVSAIESLVKHVTDLGHRKIGMITGDMAHIVVRERLDIFQAMLQRLGLQQNPDWIASTIWQEYSGYEAAMQMLQLPDHPTAILAANDLVAIGVIRAVRELGFVVGQDISVTGFDDLPQASEDYLQITTIRQPLSEIGARALALMTSAVNGSFPDDRIVRVQTELIVRKSTGPAPSS
jgi:DNA-binding LacI/PurR family transcriptional regulator